MKQSLDLKFGQHLTITPQLQQAIRLLQLSSVELQQEIQEVLETNPLLEEIDQLVRRTKMRSRTEFVERAVENYANEIRESHVVVVKEWTEAKARTAILRYLKGRPATYVTDIAEALGMDLDLAFRLVGSLSEEGKVVD